MRLDIALCDKLQLHGRILICISLRLCRLMPLTPIGAWLWTVASSNWNRS
jgi:hypothetical protein